MRSSSKLALAAAALGLAACVDAAPLQLPDDHPASPNAASGLIGTSTAIADYKGADDFAASSADAMTSSGHAGMPGMSSMPHAMDHGAMTSMDHGMPATPGMPQGGPSRGAGTR
jgi:hypothetical protein